MINLNGGTQSNYGGDALFEYRNNGLTISLGADYNDRNRPGDFTSYQETTTGDVTNMLDYTGTREHGGTRYGFRGGLSYDLTPKDILSTSFRFGNRDHGNSSDLDYAEWNSSSSLQSLYSSIESSKSQGDFYRVSMDYTHKFSGNDHKLYLEANYSYRDMDELSLNDAYNSSNELYDGKKYIEGGPGKDWRLKAEYKLPFSETDYLEAGYQADLEIDNEFNENYQFNLTTNQYDFLDLYSHDTKSTENIHSAFVTYAAEWGNFGYQLGLRGEYTDRSIELLGENQEFVLDQKRFLSFNSYLV